ncbi:MAG: NAD(P)-binding domain-containing protein [Amaricoccus sp.]
MAAPSATSRRSPTRRRWTSSATFPPSAPERRAACADRKGNCRARSVPAAGADAIIRAERASVNARCIGRAPARREVMKIGYVGLGAMGGVLAERLLGQVDLTVLDLNQAAVARMVKGGAGQAESALALGRDVDVVLLCLPRSADVEKVIFGANGLTEGLSAGKLVIDQTSGIPGVTAEIARRLSAKGVLMVDAPVAGGPPAAKAGMVTIMGSGPNEAWTLAEPVLRRISPKVFHISDRVGDGQAMKLVNNAIGAGYRVSTLELAAVGRRFGLELGEISDRLNAGSAKNFTTKGMLAALVEGRSTTDFAMALMVKDLNEALALAAAADTPSLMVAGARSIMQSTVNLFGKGAKLDDIIPMTERLAAVSLAGPAEAEAEELAEGETSDQVAATIEAAVDVCNQIIVCEWAAIGAGFGLSATAMSDAINAGSAWSTASERILPALADGRLPNLPGTLATMTECLRAARRLAARAGVPLWLPSAALSVIEAARNELGPAANPGRLAEHFAKAAGIAPWTKARTARPA